jgi:diacylglycerol kinase family enzyme
MNVGSRRCILNPVSGTGDHAQWVTRLLEARGFDVVETSGPEDAVRLAMEAGFDEVSELAVCGGDGTINEALRGLAAAEHVEDVTLSVVPAGTANLLAENVGIRDIKHGIEVADTGDVRRVDIGMADEQPFLVSCIAGLPADASVSTGGDLKERFGTLAFLLTGAQEALQFDGLTVTLEDRQDGITEAWSGEALCVLIGNARKFVEKGGQADMEDGLFDVAVVEEMPPQSLVAEGVAHRLLGQQTQGVEHFRTSELRISSDDGPITFSRDGEVTTHEELLLFAEPHSLDLRVGADYVASPD